MRLLIVAAIACSSTLARADDPKPVGITMAVGGGVTAGLGVMWMAQVDVGSRRPLGLVVTYSGTDRAASIAGTRDGSVEGSAIDAALRATLLARGAWSLYALGGVGWQRDVVVGAIETMPVEVATESSGPVLVLGAGARVRLAPSVVLDLSGRYVNGWDAIAALGFEL